MGTISSGDSALDGHRQRAQDGAPDGCVPAAGRARGGRLDIAVPLPPQALLRLPRRRLPFPLEDERHRLYARARHGLWHGLIALGLGPGDEVLAPAYHHGSEIETLIRAGLVCRFYDCGEGLEPDPGALARLHGPRVRALYLTHHLGIPQDVSRWRRWCDDRGLLLVEDGAQAWLGSHAGHPLGSLGDMAIFCLHKSFGLPDGGALISRVAPAAPSGRPAPGIDCMRARQREWLAQRSGGRLALRPGERDAHREPAVPERQFALGDPDRPPARATTLLLRRLVDPRAAGRRRANWHALFAALEPLVPPALRGLPAGAAPYVFPVAARRKAELLDHLARHDVLGGQLWEVPHPSLRPQDFPGASAVRSTIVGLPVHQELSAGDLERLIRVVRSAPRGAVLER